jgi:hypothetical protein
VARLEYRARRRATYADDAVIMGNVTAASQHGLHRKVEAVGPRRATTRSKYELPPALISGNRSAANKPGAFSSRAVSAIDSRYASRPAGSPVAAPGIKPS